MKKKVCWKCEVEKGLKEFHKNKNRHDGVDHTCKVCSNSRHRGDYNKDKLASRLKYRNCYWRNREEIRKRDKLRPRGYFRAWYLANLEKNLARGKLRYQIKIGKIIRPTVCSRCNETKDPIHAHHVDYSKPFDVVWLCRQCHELEHHPL